MDSGFWFALLIELHPKVLATTAVPATAAVDFRKLLRVKPDDFSSVFDICPSSSLLKLAIDIRRFSHILERFILSRLDWTPAVIPVSQKHKLPEDASARYLENSEELASSVVHTLSQCIATFNLLIYSFLAINLTY